MSDVPCLWQFRVSHFNEKVRWALDFKAWPHRRRTIVPGLHHVPVYWKSRQIALPILDLDGTVYKDSTAIIAELERRRPAPALYPENPEERRRALAIEDYFDENVAPDVRALFWWSYLDLPRECAQMATDGAGRLAKLAFASAYTVARPVFRRQLGATDSNAAVLRGRLGTTLAKLEAAIGADGYLVGRQFSVADLTAAAIMTAILRPPEFSYPLPEPWPARLVELRDEIASHPASRWVYDVYRRHRGRSFEVQPPA